jgi:hypothetical protein
MKTPTILGGSPIRTKLFPKRVTMGKEEKNAVLKVMDSGVLSAFIGAAGMFFSGEPAVQVFEKAWADQS